MTECDLTPTSPKSMYILADSKCSEFNLTNSLLRSFYGFSNFLVLQILTEGQNFAITLELIMPELQKLSRQQIIKSLTPSNIFNEIKTDMCIQYAELRSCYSKYLQENLTAAMSSDTLQEILISALSPAGRETADLLRDVFQKPPTPITTSSTSEAAAINLHMLDHVSHHDHWGLHHDSGFHMTGLDGDDHDDDLFSDEADSLDYV